MLCGGLGEISWFINDSNYYLRGQAFEVLLSITDCGTFDWFQHHDGNTTARTLHHHLLGLSCHPNFLSGLLENREKSYPGGSLRALQLLAFWLSWVRAVNTTNHVLILSESLLQGLKLWSEGKGDDLGEDEINLAKTIYIDFSYEQFHREGSSGLSSNDAIAQLHINETAAPSVTASANSADRPVVFVSGFEISDCEGCDAGGGRTLPSLRLNRSGILEPTDLGALSIEERILSSIEREKASTRSDNSPITQDQHAPLQCTEVLVERARSLKDEGNDLFKMSKYSESLSIYSEAISLLGPVCQDGCNRNDEAHPSTSGLSADESSKASSSVVRTLLASLHFNCATAYFKLSELKDVQTSDMGRILHNYEEKCESSCRSALESDSTHCKSLYRLSCVLLQRGRSVEALEAMEKFSATSDLDETLKAVRRRCLAAVIAKGEGEGSTEGAGTGTAGSRDKPESPSCESAVKDLTTPDGRSANIDIAEAAIGSRAAKVLRALQTRATRGKGSHSTPLNSCPARDRKESSRSGRVFDEEDDRNLERLLGTSLAIGGGSSKGTTLTQQTANVSNMPTKKEKEIARKGGKKADVKISKFASTKNVAEAYGKLRKLSALFEKSFSSARELMKCVVMGASESKGDCSIKTRGPLDDVFDVMDTHVKAGIQVRRKKNV